MRGLSLLLLGALTIVSHANATCDDGRRMYKPASGKTGFRMEIIMAAGATAGRALIYRPFSSAPDNYQLIADDQAAPGSRYRMIGPAGSLQLDIAADGAATIESNRDIPALWKLDC